MEINHSNSSFLALIQVTRKYNSQTVRVDTHILTVKNAKFSHWCASDRVFIILKNILYLSDGLFYLKRFKRGTNLSISYDFCVFHETLKATQNAIWFRQPKTTLLKQVRRNLNLAYKKFT